MIDKETSADGGSGMYFHSGEESRQLRQDTWYEGDVGFPQKMGYAMKGNRPQSGIKQEFDVSGSRIIAIDRLYILN